MSIPSQVTNPSFVLTNSRSALPSSTSPSPTSSISTPCSPSSFQPEPTLCFSSRSSLSRSPWASRSLTSTAQLYQMLVLQQHSSIRHSPIFPRSTTGSGLVPPRRPATNWRLFGDSVFLSVCYLLSAASSAFSCGRSRRCSSRRMLRDFRFLVCIEWDRRAIALIRGRTKYGVFTWRRMKKKGGRE